MSSMIPNTEIQYLLDQYLLDIISIEEKQRLQELLQQPENLQYVDEKIMTELFSQTYLIEPGDQVREQILQHLAAQRESVVIMPMQRVHFLRRWGWVAAASVILLLGISVYVFVSQTKEKNIVSKTQPKTNDILPGINRAVLTVDNKKIDLSTDKAGIAVGNTVTYLGGEKLSDAGQMLQLATPRGGQYQLVLPDESKVWLNAASSIKFPSKFSNDERRVEVTGEVYMEVAKNLQAPFKVTAGNTTVQVLGTSFNINAYVDEESLRTTLISGAVKIVSNNQAVILKPGEAADVTKKIRVSYADVEQDVAWKNDVFNFTNMDLAAILRQLARWYNLDVRFEGEPSPATFRGKMSRRLPLSKVLTLLNGLNVQFKIEGKTLTVKNQ